MNVLVLNLTRLGDLLQSQPAIAGLAARGHRVGLVCLASFAPAAALMRELSAVFPLPGERLTEQIATDWRAALAGHRQLLEDVRGNFPPDAVINLTPSEPARLLSLTLARAGEGAQSLGFGLDEHGFNADAGLWAAFLQLSAATRGASPFNVADLFRRICGLTEPCAEAGLRGVADQERAAARTRLLERVPEPPRRGFVALQLGASDDRRRWPVEYFAHAARGLSEAGWTPVLVGAQSERPLGERLKAQVRVPLADLMGATNLPQLAATLANCALLATNDTGTMHLAAGLGVPCLAIFLATAQPWDTGPALPGSLCLEPDLPCHPCAFGVDCPNGLACRRSIRPEGVLELALGLLDGGGPQAACPPGARAWRTVAGADGFLDLESLSGHGAEDRTRLIRLQRALYRPYLDGEAVEAAGAPSGLSPEGSRPLAASLDEALSLLHLLSRQGELLAREPVEALRTKFLATWQRVRGSLEARPALALLASLWTFEAERPGLGLPELLALCARFAALLSRLRQCV